MGKKYVKIWEDFHNQKLPSNKEIHHIDGNNKNNDPLNLQAVTLEEHLEIHLKQHDYGAAQAITMRMNLTEEERQNIAQLASLNQQKLWQNGTHNWQINGEKRKLAAQKMMDERIKSGKGAYLVKDPVKNGKNARSRMSRETELYTVKCMYEKTRNTFWWNNGKINKRSKDCPGPEFKKGMLYHES